MRLLSQVPSCGLAHGLDGGLCKIGHRVDDADAVDKPRIECLAPMGRVTWFPLRWRRELNRFGFDSQLSAVGIERGVPGGHSIAVMLDRQS